MLLCSCAAHLYNDVLGRLDLDKSLALPAVLSRHQVGWEDKNGGGEFFFLLPLPFVPGNSRDSSRASLTLRPTELLTSSSKLWGGLN